MNADLLKKPYRALFYDDLKEYERVIEELTDHLKGNPNNGIAYNNRGVAYWEIGDFERALLDLDMAIQNATGGHIPFLNRGQLSEKLGDIEKAIEDYSRAIAVAHDATAYRCRALAYVKVKALSNAIDDFSQAILLEPNFRETYLNRAKAYEAIGDLENAQRDLQLAQAAGSKPGANEVPRSNSDRS
jgi:tetratricopeptide (TPR) repeat protein